LSRKDCTDPGAREIRESGGVHKPHNTRIGSASFRTGFRSSDRRQSSGYVLRDMRVISIIIVDGPDN